MTGQDGNTRQRGQNASTKPRRTIPAAIYRNRMLTAGQYATRPSGEARKAGEAPKR